MIKSSRGTNSDQGRISRQGDLLVFFIRYKSSEKWLGWQGSNLRMPASKAGALPLGDTPIFRLTIGQLIGEWATIQFVTAGQEAVDR